MKYPEFYNQVKAIKLYDPLSEFLGSFEDGIIEFNYLNIVQAAGHSCPTVAGAYLITYKALEALYPNEIAERGNIRVEFRENIEEGVAGVIANVISNITGATRITGFKGIAGKFVRHSLMDFGANINSSARFTRKDTNKSVEVYYNPSSVGGSPMMQPLMQKIMSGMASKEEKVEFGNMWQARVKAIIIDNCDNEAVIKVVEL
ncbi:MAG: hypothetical protein B6I18_05755 [Bacteroidetes bacterium 4572_112]|nr:MAG: hypothetical protein B6I18_05755 [Bacteroidetes bacterium 4572_112]